MSPFPTACSQARDTPGDTCNVGAARGLLDWCASGNLWTVVAARRAEQPPDGLHLRLRRVGQRSREAPPQLGRLGALHQLPAGQHLRDIMSCADHRQNTKCYGISARTKTGLCNLILQRIASNQEQASALHPGRHGRADAGVLSDQQVQRLTVPVEVAMTRSSATRMGHAAAPTPRTAAASMSTASAVAGTGCCSNGRSTAQVCITLRRSTP